MIYLITFILNLSFINLAYSEPQAILISGGGSAHENHCDFNDDIDRANGILKGWKKVNLVADGDIPNGPPNSLSCNANRRTIPGAELVRAQTEAPINGPAKKAVLVDKLSQISNLKDGEPVLLYFTNHGGRKVEDKNAKFSLSLWDESLSKEEIQRIIENFKKFHPKNPLIFIHDHCFSGGMMDNYISSQTGEVIPGVCGFSAASQTEYSYTGQSYMRKAEEMLPIGSNNKNVTFSNVFDRLKFEGNIFSTPTSTSDAFLEKVYQDEKKNLGNLSVSTIFCLQEIKPTAIDKLTDMLMGVNKLQHNGYLKNQIEDLSAKAKVSVMTSLDKLESLLLKKQNEVIETEQQVEVAKNVISDAKGSWADAELVNIYGTDVTDRIWISEDRTERITLRDGTTKTRQELMNAFNEKFTAANVGNISFTNFIAEGARADRWPADLLDRPKILNKLFAKQNTEAGPLMRLVQTSRRASALNHLSPEKLDQYVNLLNCENTPIIAKGLRK